VDIVQSFVYLGSEIHGYGRQNQKFDTGSVWQNLVLINLTEESGAPAFPSLPKFSYIEFTFNRFPLWFWNMGLGMSIGSQDHCLWQYLPPTYSLDSVHRPCFECWCTNLSRLSTTSALTHPDKTSLLLQARSKDERHAEYLQSPTYVDLRTLQGLEASPRPPTPHLAFDHRADL